MIVFFSLDLNPYQFTRGYNLSIYFYYFGVIYRAEIVTKQLTSLVRCVSALISSQHDSKNRTNVTP